MDLSAIYYLCGCSLGCGANVILKKVGERLSFKWNKSCSEVLDWIQVILSVLLISTTDLCLKGSRVKWRSDIDMEDSEGHLFLEL